MQKNRFAGAAFDDSDDEPVVVQKQTKTQKKKEERKITEAKPVKFNANKMAEGGFEVVNKDTKESKPAAPKGRGERKPRAEGTRIAYKNDAEGVQHKERKERQPFRGKAREEGHPYDRRDGTGRGRRPDKKDGHGKGNWGDKPEVSYKKKNDEEEKKEEPVEKKEEKKVEEPKVQIIEEVLGYDLDEVLAQKTAVSKKQAREAEGIKGAKVQALEGEKEKQSTLVASSYGQGVTTNDGNKELFGFAAAPEDEDDRRGKRGAPRQAAPQKGGRKQNAKQALKKTEEDFPSL
mmetsp:Transcript_40564/g.61826  ORF Transcript_40564/g.61826 Transcript_40564/m.61826 type:complete len:290 (-) Transcript_40564:188-1057(-)|eukprot:CAMPEP_0170482690 /NCGR_PEP_ID=MMETSP0208-20121228/2595_1 /TAXON_ID=197538 /ORGANISM="Strombidium inclinatum, Strain S3" /LENGTH=289 /DNA_ID=CAMNT_0010755551 /DNA_START=346 /DNA_END=1215 /DNA_ORIENTATION=-